MVKRRYDWERFEERVRARLLGVGRPTGVKTIAALFGTHPREIYRWREAGVTRDRAERCADAMRWHIYEVWPEIRDDDIAALPSGVCAAPGCDRVFTAVSYRQRYCEEPCRARAKASRRKASVKARDADRLRRRRPDAAERNRQARRRYYAENGDYERARQRRYYAAQRAAQLEREAA